MAPLGLVAARALCVATLLALVGGSVEEGWQPDGLDSLAAEPLDSLAYAEVAEGQGLMVSTEDATELRGRVLRATVCGNGTVKAASGQCIRGWVIDYCDFKGGKSFTPNTYKYYGRLRFFRLPTMQDAVKPNKGQYAVSGDCKFIVDSSCVVQRAFSCGSCCFISPVPILLTNSPCFNNPLKQCNYTFSQNSANCGNPPLQYQGNTICNVCTRV